AAALYAAFPEEWWAQREPPALRPPLQSTRQTRLATRLRPSLSHPNMYWVKATHVPTSRIAGLAGWMAPGHPIHNVWRRSATDFFHWADKHNWSQQDVDDMWAGVDVDYWDGRCRADDEIRRQVMGDEPHWYLAPLLTLPEFQGRGIGSLLLKWAMDQADATDPVTPLYLEASAMGRPVYLHHGFVPVGEHNMVRRGP
ncbi:acyl-CoA N-acyltransferase, partial [Westerdykella ornata]